MALSRKDMIDYRDRIKILKKKVEKGELTEEELRKSTINLCELAINFFDGYLNNGAR